MAVMLSLRHWRSEVGTTLGSFCITARRVKRDLLEAGQSHAVGTHALRQHRPGAGRENQVGNERAADGKRHHVAAVPRERVDLREVAAAVRRAAVACGERAGDLGIRGERRRRARVDGVRYRHLGRAAAGAGGGDDHGVAVDPLGEPCRIQCERDGVGHPRPRLERLSHEADFVAVQLGEPVPKLSIVRSSVVVAALP
jgi:hypothetical protein